MLKGKSAWITLLCFELLYKVLSAVVFTPLFFAVFNGVMHVSGYPYLTLENVLLFLQSPLTIGMLIVLAFLICVYSVFDISAVIFVLEQIRQGKYVSLHQTIIYAYHNAKRVVSRKNVALLFMVLFLIPFLNLGVASSYVSTISVPSFVKSYIVKNRLLIAACIGVWALFTALLLRWLFAFHYFTLETVDFQEACRRSARLIRGRKIKDALFLLFVQTVFYLCHFLFTAIAILIVLLVGKVISDLHIANIMYTSAIWVLLIVIMFLVSALGMPVSYGAISALFYSHKKKLGEPVRSVPAPPYPQGRFAQMRIRAAQAALFVVGVFGCVYLVYQSSTEKIDLQIEYLGTMEVTGHRGASRNYPENTMAAFEAALEQGADWIELDIQQSKDGQIFVMHDRNFKRTTGLDKYSWELDYAEIAQLDAGIKFGAAYAGERIPLLRDVIVFAKENNIRLNIELKPAGFETDFEKNVVDIILEEEFADRCVLTSQKYETLENIKNYCEEISTVYVMSLAYGNVNRMQYADHFSMEASSVTPAMVSRIHNAGKQIYAWTVNSRSAINRMIDLNVDNIITDNITLAQQCIYESKTSDVLQKYIRYIRRR